MSNQDERSQVGGKSNNYQSPEYPQITVDFIPNRSEDEEIFPMQEKNSENLKIRTERDDEDDREFMPNTPLISDGLGEENFPMQEKVFGNLKICIERDDGNDGDGGDDGDDREFMPNTPLISDRSGEENFSMQEKVSRDLKICTERDGRDDREFMPNTPLISDRLGEKNVPMQEKVSGDLKICTKRDDGDDRGFMPNTPLISDRLGHDKIASLGFANSNSKTPYPPSYDQENQGQDDNKSIERNVYLNCFGRYLITLSLCAGYVIVIMIWLKKSATSFYGKRIFNSLTTGISIALGLNLSGSFREIALTMRWSILALGKQNLEEVDLLLQANNLISFIKLANVSRRPLIKIGGIFWISVNILTQFGLALISLTYSFDNDSQVVHLKTGKAAIAKMDHFYPRSNHVDMGISLQDEQYTAHTYGQFALTFGIGLASSKPTVGQRYLRIDPLLWLDKTNSLIEFIFLDSPKGTREIDSFSAYTQRKIGLEYKCKSFDVLSGGNGRVSQIEVDGVGTVYLSKAVPDSTTYLTRSNHTCEGNSRCSIVEVFESSATEPWYYVCEISLGLTQNDVHGISAVNDYMAQIATASIAQIGYTDFKGFASQVYPRQSLWGQISKGDSQSVGMMIALYAIASIAGAAQFNPFTSYTTECAPSQGFRLKLKHSRTLTFILALVNITQLGFFVAAIVLSKKGKAIASHFIDIILLLKPITDRLPKFCLIEDGKESRKLKSQIYARYEKDVISKNDWNFKIHSK
ncbi:hypothetical protein EPUL_003850 [Erysiphe pulchra]|uniref:Uncharacterized protein n=1 Tax=Erysiphe pulchra TaxID=225359 RepID=A0A2S4PSY3_9PEZI|nr:hypothetical protein EPUL_003850 [Erysiphe pulchra]